MSLKDTIYGIYEDLSVSFYKIAPLIDDFSGFLPAFFNCSVKNLLFVYS